MKEKISIIMGVYNSESTIDECIESIIKQTYSNWEFVICDDASTDNTYEKLMKYKKLYPDKFTILKNSKNHKLAYSLNKCIEHSNGHFIARMDADDISLPRRLELQVEFLKRNPIYSLVGSSMQRFNERGLHDIVFKEKEPNKYSMRDGSPFHHSTIMTYKSVYVNLNGYLVSKYTKRSQDYELWFRFFNHNYKAANIQEPLVLFRENTEAIRRRTPRVRLEALVLTYRGYKLLEFPLFWYIKPTIITILKSLTPYSFQSGYRMLQSKKILSKRA